LKRRLLLLLPQSPFDFSNGAARSMLSMCRMLVGAGWEVRTMCVTTCEETGAGSFSRLGLNARPTKIPSVATTVWQVEDGGIAHNLLDTGTLPLMKWEATFGKDFVAALGHLLKQFTPDVLLTYGGTNTLMQCRGMVREKGAAVVIGLRNHGHFVQGALLHADRALAPSRWLADKYAAFFGRSIDSMPSPLIESEVLPDARDPVFFSFVNPAPHKGMMFFARLADEVSRQRPDIPFLVVDSHGTCQEMLRAALKEGVDLHARENIMLAEKVAHPKDFLRVTRAALVPSLWNEPSGRVAEEALLAGIPALVSNRGGLPETVGDGGIVLAIPDAIKPLPLRLPPPEAVRPWVEAILRLADDEAYYKKACADAARAGERFRENTLTPEYVRYFENLASGRK
jgi:glycosyltransferase involved in cell wall biosynthesis